MKKYKEFIKEGSIFIGGKSYTSDADRMAAYNDLSPDNRKLLDEYCKMKFGNIFQNCTYEEQSTARSVVWEDKKDSNDIENENDREAKM